jgi:hypothetical protein
MGIDDRRDFLLARSERRELAIERMDDFFSLASDRW